MLAMAQKIADKSVPIRGTPAEAYVKARGISIPSLVPEALRDLHFCPAEGEHSAMLVATVRDITTGKPTGSIHRTFIHDDGTRVLEGGKPAGKKGLGAHGEFGIGRLKSVKLPPGVQPVLLAQQKKVADRLGWIDAAKHYAAQGHDVEIA